MTLGPIVIAAAVAAIVAGAIWLFLPRFMVKGNLYGDDKSRLELENSYRTTVTTAISAGGLALSFLWGIERYYQDQSREAQLHEETAFADAITKLDGGLESEKNGAVLSAIFSLRDMGIQKHERTAPAIQYLTGAVRVALDRDRSEKAHVLAKLEPEEAHLLYKECRPSWEFFPDVSSKLRDGVPRVPGITEDLAIRALNDLLRAYGPGSPEKLTLYAEPPFKRLILDGANFSRMTFADYIDLSGSALHRANFSRTVMRNAHFDGVELADYQVAGWEPAFGAALSDEKMVEPWQRHLCWSADFRDADLKGAIFDGAGLGGADFRGADLTGATFYGAMLSRADFRKAKVSREQLEFGADGRQEGDHKGGDKPCIGDPDLNDEGDIHLVGIKSDLGDFQPHKCSEPRRQ